ncbi:hypothetical protein [Arachnia propionica]|uniref:hypothetical protein n=1 Tax=Arachnia propionica TaxID=1750 RepID=UPI0021AE1CCC|nr:hypothetical protein [Arachnia propionica]
MRSNPGVPERGSSWCWGGRTTDNTTDSITFANPRPVTHSTTFCHGHSVAEHIPDEDSVAEALQDALAKSIPVGEPQRDGRAYGLAFGERVAVVNGDTECCTNRAFTKRHCHTDSDRAAHDESGADGHSGANGLTDVSPTGIAIANQCTGANGATADDLGAARGAGSVTACAA